MEPDVQSVQNSIPDGKENLSRSLESWKQIEDLMFQVNEESMTEALLIVQNELSEISADTILNLIIRISNTRPFAFKLLGNVFQKFFESKKRVFSKSPFTRYLYSLGILSDSNFKKKPDDVCVPGVYENISQVGSLSYSIMNDNLEEVISQSASFNNKEFKINIFKNSFVPIDFASFCGSINVFKYLLINGCDITSSTKEWAIKGGHYNIVQIIEQNGHSFDDHLGFAIEYHHHHLFDWLVEHYKSKDVSLQNCIEWWNTTACDYYVHKGADIESGDNCRNTPLLCACSNGHLEVVKYLIDKGAKIGKGDFFGFRPLMCASIYGHLEVVKYLIGKGAPIEARNQDGCTALFCVSSCGHIEIVKYLIDKGADIESMNYNARTPLIHASDFGKFEIVKYLIEKGANIKSEDYDGWTPLIIASMRGHLEVVKYLIEKGANIKSKRKPRKSALDIAGTDEIKTYIRNYGQKE